MPHPLVTWDEVLDSIMNDSDSGSEYEMSDEVFKQVCIWVLGVTDEAYHCISIPLPKRTIFGRSVPCIEYIGSDTPVER